MMITVGLEGWRTKFAAMTGEEREEGVFERKGRASGVDDVDEGNEEKLRRIWGAFSGLQRVAEPMPGPDGIHLVFTYAVSRLQ